MWEIVLIQVAQDTGRFHPAAYRLAPLPGGAPPNVHRYRSTMHHTVGFDAVEQAQAAAELLAGRLAFDSGMAPQPGPYELLTVAQAGPDILLRSP